MINRGKLMSLFLVVTSVLFILDTTSARGGARGGGSRYRSSSSRSVKRINGLTWRSALSAKTVYGAASYMRRTRYREDPDKAPEICHNIYDYKDENLKTYDYFICPLPDQSEEYLYCCGDEDRQHCCEYFDDPERVEVIVGEVFGVLLMLAIAVWLWCRKK